jgi:hypothetical protein
MRNVTPDNIPHPLSSKAYATDILGLGICVGALIYSTLFKASGYRHGYGNIALMSGITFTAGGLLLRESAQAALEGHGRVHVLMMCGTCLMSAFTRWLFITANSFGNSCCGTDSRMGSFSGKTSGKGSF